MVYVKIQHHSLKLNKDHIIIRYSSSGIKSFGLRNRARMLRVTYFGICEENLLGSVVPLRQIPFSCHLHSRNCE
jgi:hypothetical protein